MHNGQYEPIDLKFYKMYIPGFYVYRNIVYFRGIPIRNQFNMSGLAWLHSGYNHDLWICDGNLLTNDRLLRRNDISSSSPYEFHCVPVANANNLKMVTRELLTDGINFYQLSYNNIDVIPINRLGMKVKIEIDEVVYKPKQEK